MVVEEWKEEAEEDEGGEEFCDVLGHEFSFFLL